MAEAARSSSCDRSIVLTARVANVRMIQFKSILDLWPLFPFSIITLKNNSTSYAVCGGTCAHASRAGAGPGFAALAQKDAAL